MRCPFQVRAYCPFQRTYSVPSCFPLFRFDSPPLASVIPAMPLAETYVRGTSHPTSTAPLGKVTDFLRAKPSCFSVAPTSYSWAPLQTMATHLLDLSKFLSGPHEAVFSTCMRSARRLNLPWLTLRLWKWRYVSPKRQWTAIELHAITTQPLLWEPQIQDTPFNQGYKQN
jgi:hypothetical protein